MFLVFTDFFFYKIVRFFFHCKIFNFYKIFFSHLLILKTVQSIKVLIFLYDVYFQGIFKNTQNLFFPSRCKKLVFNTNKRIRFIKFLLLRKLKSFSSVKSKLSRQVVKSKPLNNLRLVKTLLNERLSLKNKVKDFKKKNSKFFLKKPRTYLFSSVKYYNFLRKSYINLPLSNLHFLMWNPRETFKSIFFSGLRHREFFPFQTLQPLTDNSGNLTISEELEHSDFPYKIVRALPSSYMVPSMLQLANLFSVIFYKLTKLDSALDVFILNLGRQTLTARLLCEHMLRKILFKGKPKTRHSTVTKGFFSGYLVYLRRIENLIGCSIVAKGRIVRQQRSMYKWIAHYGYFSRNRRNVPTTYCKGSIATKNGVLTILVFFTKFFVPKALFLSSFISISDFYFSRTNFQRIFFNKFMDNYSRILSQNYLQSNIFRERSIYFGKEPIIFSNNFSGAMKQRFFFPVTSIKKVKRKFVSYQEFLNVDFNLRRRLKKLYRLRVKESNFRIL